MNYVVSDVFSVFARSVSDAAICSLGIKMPYLELYAVQIASLRSQRRHCFRKMLYNKVMALFADSFN